VSLPEGHGTALAQLLSEYIARIDWSPERIEEERTRALRALLTVAVERSSRHRRRLAGIDIGSVSAREVVGLPIMTKRDLIDEFDAIVTDPRLSRKLCEDHLGRSPGEHLLDEFQVIVVTRRTSCDGSPPQPWTA
jgi:phenylacetate-CoA ligase